MKRIVFFGDSITDGCRNKERDDLISSLGSGFVLFAAGKLLADNPYAYEIFNRGIGGNRSVDLYARIKKDVWELQPDVVNILVGINDIWHEQMFCNGLDVGQYEEIYRLIVEQTKKRLPNAKLILCEPFVLRGRVTEENFAVYERIYDYAKVVKRLADEYGETFLPLQETIANLAQTYGDSAVLVDGIHPTAFCAEKIATEWVKCWKQIESA